MVDCFYCSVTFDKSESFKMTVEMAEGQAEYDVCPDCSGDLNEILKGIEAAKNEV